MSELQKSRSSSSRHPTPDIVISESDGRFFRSLYDSIDQEKKYLQCSENPDEVRYLIYRSVFHKVIGRATAYKRLLMTIKMEYDDVIREMKRREDEVRASQRTAAAQTSHRISVLQSESADVQEDIRRQKTSKETRMWIAGLSVAQSEDPEALDRHLQVLEAQRAALQNQRSLCVPLEVQTRLDAKLQDVERHRDHLSSQNQNLRVLYNRLRCVSECLSRWEEEEDEEEEEEVPLEEVLGSMLEDVGQIGATDGDPDLLEDEFRLLLDHLDRFIELFESDRFEDAALLAARCPGGVLRNLDIMDMFRGVQAPPGCPPPPLLFFRALLVTVPVGGALSAVLSLQGVLCALQHGGLRLVAHAVTQNKLTFSEDLGDLLTEHAQKDPGGADMCLALATVVYESCRLDRKTALSMCRRGLVHGAAEFMEHCQDIRTEDILWVLSHSPSPSLLQLLTEPRRDRAAILSVGVTCAALLADPQQQQLALQLLDGFVGRGQGRLEEAILEDAGSSVDVWTDVASLCCDMQRADLSRVVRSVLLDQSGTGVVSPDPEGAELMEHVFL
ncbi:clathrin heavy chain linker domain-containing protein 1-like [Embiotoca jacksoni]|uniref:clathrin heavy chain linker domain-containing protein 1-like n=1 Tax=Embiotoca jacksoni TaxID=100190 RepID=UPI003703AB31